MFLSEICAVSHKSQLWNEFTGKSGHTAVDLRLKFNGHNHILIELNSTAYSQMYGSTTHVHHAIGFTVMPVLQP
jgi:hypothetical protein